MEPVSSLPHSQVPATYPSHEPAWSSSYPHPTSWKYILILSSHLRLGLPGGLFPSGFSTKPLFNSWINKATDTFIIFNNYFCSTAAVVTRTHLIVTLYVHLPVLFPFVQNPDHLRPASLFLRQTGVISLQTAYWPTTRAICFSLVRMVVGDEKFRAFQTGP